MQAVIRDGGHQYRVAEGDTLDIELRRAEAGSTLEFGDVLVLSDTAGAPRIGTPTIAGAKVVAKVVGETPGEKVIVAQFRRRKNSRRRVGHRQSFLRVTIESIQG